MESIDKSEGYIHYNPLLLLNVKNLDLSIYDKYLPYSIGIEIETEYLKEAVLDEFNVIYLLRNSSSNGELRFRIPNGLRGLICLYLLTIAIKRNCYFNESSGIHYHVDMTDSFHLINSHSIYTNKNWILEELDTWQYKGTYNKRTTLLDARCWVRYKSSYRTAEFRIGEMTFDYELLFKRISHCCSIVSKLKTNLRFKEELKFEPVNKEDVVTNLSNFDYNLTNLIDQLELIKQKEKPIDFNVANQVINQRVTCI